VAPLVEYLPSKCSNPSATKKKKEEEKQRDKTVSLLNRKNRYPLAGNYKNSMKAIQILSQCSEF
jgi:hypothetical protein